MIWCLIQYKVNFALLDIELYSVPSCSIRFIICIMIVSIKYETQIGIKNMIWVVVQNVVFWQTL